jgi:hypothetical protein
MGWYFESEKRTKREFANSIINGLEYRFLDSKVIAHRLDGKELWLVEQYTSPKTGNIESIIVLFLLDSQNGSWGYKCITENMGPYYYKCPVKFLDLAPVANPEWRAKVLAAAERRAATKAAIKFIEVGDTLVLPDNYSPNRLKVDRSSP